MLHYLSCFESFAFKTLKFDDRATRLEYWGVMPVIWLLILAMVPGDIAEFWQALLNRQPPSLNPLNYTSVLLFVLTFLPRLSLTVRRLHDSGKSGKWVKLPFLTVSSGLMLALGLGSAVLTSNIAGGGALSPASTEAATGLGVMAFLGMAASETAWEGAFAVAAAIEAVGWDAIWMILADLLAATPAPDVSAGLSNISQDMQNDPGLTSVMLMMVILMTAMPFVTALLHIYFMSLPSEQDENSYGQGAGPAKKTNSGPKSNNPFAGYVHLYPRSAEEEERRKITHKEEIRTLYQTRVLGSQSH